MQLIRHLQNLPPTSTYTSYGILFGLCLPLSAWALDITTSNLSFSFLGIVHAHQHNYLHWIIDSVPVILGTAGNFLGIQKSKLDTYAKTLEEQVSQYAEKPKLSLVETKHTNKAKPIFLYYMSHELRTPMNTILSFAQLLHSEPLNEEQSQSVKEILKAGSHMLLLVEDLLNLNQIEAGLLNLNIEPVLLQPIINNCLSTIIPLANKQQTTLTNLSAPFTDCFVYVDSLRLKQVLLHLLANVIKFNAEKGTITIHTTHKNNERVRISITDTGAELSSEQQGDLLEKFELEHTGLFITKKLVERMDGEIGFTSTPSVGNTFWVEFKCIATADSNHTNQEYKSTSS